MGWTPAAHRRRREARQNTRLLFGIKVTPTLKREFCARILSRDYFFKESESEVLTHYIMNVRSRLVRIVYDESAKAIVKFLPPNTCNRRLFKVAK